MRWSAGCDTRHRCSSGRSFSSIRLVLFFVDLRARGACQSWVPYSLLPSEIGVLHYRYDMCTGARRLSARYQHCALKCMNSTSHGPRE